MSAGTCVPPGQVPPSNNARRALHGLLQQRDAIARARVGEPVHRRARASTRRRPCPARGSPGLRSSRSSAAACLARSPGARSVTRATSVPTCRPGCSAADGRERRERLQRGPVGPRRRVEDRREEVVGREHAVEAELRGPRRHRERPGGSAVKTGSDTPSFNAGGSSTSAAAPTTPGMVAERRHDDGNVGAHLGGLDGVAIRRTRGLEQQVAGLGDAARHQHDLRDPGCSRGPPIPTPSQRPTSREDRDRDGVSVTRGPGDHRARSRATDRPALGSSGSSRRRPARRPRPARRAPRPGPTRAVPSTRGSRTRTAGRRDPSRCGRSPPRTRARRGTACRR